MLNYLDLENVGPSPRMRPHPAPAVVFAQRKPSRFDVL